MNIEASHWKSFLVRGILAVVFGILTMLMPGIALLSFVLLFGAYAIADGVSHLVTAFRGRGGSRKPSGIHFFAGLIGIVAGLFAIFLPGATAMAFLYIIAGWAMASGIVTIVQAIRLRKEIRGEWLLGLGGALSFAFGVLLAAFPSAGAVALMLWIGVYALIFGVILIALSLKLRSYARGHQEPMAGVLSSAPRH